MTISHRYHSDRSKLALELTMRDALEGLEELANLNACWFASDCLEILSIEPPPGEPSRVVPLSAAAPAKVLNFPDMHRRAG